MVNNNVIMIKKNIITLVFLNFFMEIFLISVLPYSYVYCYSYSSLNLDYFI